MSHKLSVLLERYLESVAQVLGKGFNKMILYGSYARGDFEQDSDMDIMILVDLEDSEIEHHRKQLSWNTYDFNDAHNTDIKPITKNDAHFRKWLGVYPFYTNIQAEGVKLYGIA